MKPFAQWWIVIAISNLYGFVYTEVGTVLKLLKDPSGKFSHKRLIALALVASGLNTIRMLSVPQNIFAVIFDLVLVGGQIGAGVWLAFISAATKT